MLHIRYFCVDRICVCVFPCLCVYEYVCTSYMLPLSTWVFEMDLVYKITQDLIFSTFKLEFLWLPPDFKLPFQQRLFLCCLQCSIWLCIKKQKTFRQLQLIIWLIKWVQLLRKALFLYILLTLIESPEKALR